MFLDFICSGCGNIHNISRDDCVIHRMHLTITFLHFSCCWDSNIHNFSRVSVFHYMYLLSCFLIFFCSGCGNFHNFSSDCVFSTCFLIRLDLGAVIYTILADTLFFTIMFLDFISSGCGSIHNYSRSCFLDCMKVIVFLNFSYCGTVFFITMYKFECTAWFEVNRRLGSLSNREFPKEDDDCAPPRVN